MHRDVVLFGVISHWQVWSVATMISAGMCGLGYWTYHKLRSAFSDVL